MKIIEDSQIHLNTLRKLYQAEKRNEQRKPKKDTRTGTGKSQASQMDQRGYHQR